MVISHRLRRSHLLSPVFQQLPLSIWTEPFGSQPRRQAGGQPGSGQQGAASTPGELAPGPGPPRPRSSAHARRPEPTRAGAAGPRSEEGRRRAGSGEAREAGGQKPGAARQHRPESRHRSRDARYAVGGGGTPEGPGPERPSALQTLCGCPATSGRRVGEAGIPEPQPAGISLHPRPAPRAPGNTWLPATPSTQLERLSVVVDWGAQSSQIALISAKYPCSGAKLGCVGLGLREEAERCSRLRIV